MTHDFMGDLPDVNFWLALVWQGHAAHPVARAWWENNRERKFFFCRVTEIALLRLLTNRAVLDDEAKTQAEAWRIYELLRGSPRIEFLAESAGFNSHWKKFSARPATATQRWTDDYLAAFAASQKLTLLTFDGSFQMYPELKVELLFQPSATPAS